MRDFQRKVSDYIHQPPGASAAGEDHVAPGGSADAHASPAPERKGASEDANAILELERLSRLLQELNASMDTTMQTMGGLQTTGPMETAGPMETTEDARRSDPAAKEPAEAQPPPHSPAPRAASRHRPTFLPAFGRGPRIVLSGVGVSAGLVLLALLGWMWHANLALDPREIRSSEMAATGASNRALNDAAGATTTAAAGPSRPAQPIHPPARRSLSGVAGAAIPLGLRLSGTDPADGGSVAIEGVPAPATLTAGMRLGGDAWMVHTREADAASLLTPATFPGGRFDMTVRLVSHAGEITDAQTLAVSIAPSPAFSAAAGHALTDEAVGPEAQFAPQTGSLPHDPLQDAMPAPDAPPAPDAETREAEFDPGGLAARPMDATLQHEADRPAARMEDLVARADAAEPSLVGQASDDLPPTADDAIIDNATIDAAPIDAAAADDAGASAAGRAADAQADAEADARDAGDVGESAEPVRMAAVTDHVNMRAQPSNAARVIAVVPAGRQVGVIECGQWCHVRFNGDEGWIHNRFVAKGSSQRGSGKRASGKRGSGQRSSGGDRANAPAQDRISAADAAGGAEPAHAASVSQSVNMRTKPSNSAAVVTVVPAGTRIDVIGCRQWCQVAFAGKRGWIHRDLVSDAGGAEHASDAGSRDGFWKKLSPF